LIGKVERGLGTTLKNKQRFSLVFLDPPYRYGLVEKTLLLLEKNRVAAPGALIVAEHESKLALTAELSGWSFIKTKVFGDSAFSLWNLTKNEE
jgi:16S rRNA (guanine966-N2)-methyltransferase